MGHGKFSELAPAAMAQNSCSFLWQTSRLTVFGNGKSPRTEAGQEQQPELLNYLIEGLDTFSFVCIFFLLWLYFIFALLFLFQAMLDHIKHSIVSLQIAKNMAHPINGIYNGPTMATTTKAGAAGGGSGDASGSSGGSGIGKGGEAISALKNELAGDDEDDSATENGKCHPSAKYFLGVTLLLMGV